MPAMKRWAHPGFIVVVLLLGLAIRCALASHVSRDASDYLLPWYGFVRARGIGSFRYNFTNYTPYFTYVLLLITRLEGLAAPLALIKAFSAIFELGSAIIVARLARATGGGRWAGALAFASVWLAPTVIINGASWGQADSIWTFFILLSLMSFIQDRNGVPSFAFAFAVKAQSVFFGPFLLGMLLKRRVHWLWLAVVPVVYLLLAIPVLLVGRRLGNVLLIYLDQANTFHYLSVNAANFWIFWPRSNETVGVAIGLILATLAGLALAALTMRIPREDRERLMVAACASLLIMPFLLPKMHDRYFYAFELTSIALAWANPRYLGLAVMAQANGVLSYMELERLLPLQLLMPPAICNAGMAVLLVTQMVRPAPGRRRPSIPHLAAFAAAAVALVANLLMTNPERGSVGWFPLYAGAFCFTGILLLLAIRRGGYRFNSATPDQANSPRATTISP
jgi:Gpi18-like mannosyltransferase